MEQIRECNNRIRRPASFEASHPMLPVKRKFDVFEGIAEYGTESGSHLRWATAQRAVSGKANRDGSLLADNCWLPPTKILCRF